MPACSSLRRACLLLALIPSMACGEQLPPIRYRTEQAVIGTTFEQSICPDDLAWLDRHIAFVETSLDAVSDEPIEIYLYDEPPPQCTVLGCYTSDGYVAANWSVLDHEVVHAVVDRFATPAAFWNEGIAEALTRRGTFRGWLDSVTDNVSARDSLEVDYATAGHFVRYLIETRGLPAVRDQLAGASVEQAFGASLEALEAEYEACQDQAWLQPPPSMIHGDVPNAVENSQTHWGVLFEAGQTHELRLTAARYKVVLPTWEDDETVELTLERLGD